MFCQKCGNQMDDGSKFCTKCGNPVAGGAPGAAAPAAKPVVESKDPVLVLKPKFVLMLALLSNLAMVFYVPFVAAIFVVAFIEGSHILLVAGLVVLVVFGIIAAFPIVIKKITYGKTSYRFYNTRLDYFEGFWTVEEKTIDYRKVTEVNLRKGFIQKMFGLGTIILSTPATGGSYGMAMSGIHLKDLENPDQVYKKLKELVHN
ncbi:MAG: PH domain-containing protein [Candidatus Saganbacteria bacterium]|nr:PH domain-containing protein [Candidatus Saganbacteria bacterium]